MIGHEWIPRLLSVRSRPAGNYISALTIYTYCNSRPSSRMSALPDFFGGAMVVVVMSEIDRGMT
jgi:hypothetical protein